MIEIDRCERYCACILADLSVSILMPVSWWKPRKGLKPKDISLNEIIGIFIEIILTEWDLRI
jgi:hypothetical protein